MLHRLPIRVRAILIGASALLLATLLGACSYAGGGAAGGAGAKAAERMEGAIPAFDEPQYDWGAITGEAIAVWGDGTDMARPYLLKAFARYEELTGNEIDLVALSKDELASRLAKAFSDGGSVADQPDVILGYGGANLKACDPLRNFYDFTDAPWIDDLTDTALTQAVYDGAVIGLPHWEASTAGTLYNKHLFEELGLEVPRTQGEFLDVCDKLLAQGITPLYLPYDGASMLLYQLPLDSVVDDPDTLAALNDGTLSYADIPEMRTIIGWYKTMADRGYLGDDFRNSSWDGMDEAMKSGSHAMMLCWDTWLYTDFTGDPSQFGIMPAFVGVPEEGTFEGPNLSLVIANRNSPRLDAAIDLVTFMADPYNYNVAFGGLFTAPVFNNQAGSYSTPQFLEVESLVERLFCNSTAWLRIEGFAQTDAVHIQRYLEGDLTADECLAALDAARLERATAGSSAGAGAGE